MILRPFGVVIDGHLELGLELLVGGGMILEIRPHTGIPDPYVLSAGFVNAHSHLEYRGFQGMEIPGEGYWEWLRALTQRKREQALEEVEADCLVAAAENRATGVAMLGEHSDRPFAGLAMRSVGLRGRIYQETITFLERESPEEKLAEVELRRLTNVAGLKGRDQDVVASPHALFTVDEPTLRRFGASQAPISIHLAEHPAENMLTCHGEGPIAEFQRKFGGTTPARGVSAVSWADQLGLVRPDAQLVHLCAIEDADIAVIAARGATAAHCPRSNVALGCPIAPVRRLLEAGVSVGLGLDSAASSGEIDFFAEMRQALICAQERGEPLSAEQVWRMGVELGARSLGFDQHGIHPGSTSPLIALDIPDAQTTFDLIERGSPDRVRWVA